MRCVVCGVCVRVCVCVSVWKPKEEFAGEGSLKRESIDENPLVKPSSYEKTRRELTRTKGP